MPPNDKEYLKIVLDPIKVCADYKPKFGQAAKVGGFALTEFQNLYQSDPFYSWFGLDDPLMYAAHKAAGGMTSVYRQIGIGCEALFRRILQDSLGLSAEAVRWSYEVPKASGGARTLHLDGRVPINEIKDKTAKKQFRDWMTLAAAGVGVDKKISDTLIGTVFEVRQGYKSKDSKRQNADIANAATAYTKAYLPCAAILSVQIDKDVLLRYRAAKWVIMTGIVGANDPMLSTYDFMKDVLGYDLATFFERNRKELKTEIHKILRALLVSESA